MSKTKSRSAGLQPIPMDVAVPDGYQGPSYHLGVIDLKRAFQKAQPHAIVLNDLPSDTQEERDAIDNLIMTTYDNVDVLSPTPTCQCGRTKMGINLNRICPHCGTVCERPMESQIGLNVWMRVPKGVKAFISPKIYTMLSEILGPMSKNFSLLEWLINDRHPVPPNLPTTCKNNLQYLTDLNWPRGLNNFIDNYDWFLNILPNLITRRPQAHVRFFRDNRSRTFVEHIPLPTRTLMVLENTPVGSFADLSITGAVDAARTIVDVSRTGFSESLEVLQRKVCFVQRSISTFGVETMKTSGTKKKGWLRGQLFSSRSHFTMRAVVTSIQGVHHHEEMHIPWTQGIELFRIHLMSLLLRRDYSELDAFNLLEAAGRQYCPIVDDLFHQLLGGFEPFTRGWGTPDSPIYLPPLQGAPAIVQRNPSLTRTSAQNLFITKIKEDIMDKTISISDRIIKGPNGDFDGDEFNITLLLSQALGSRGSLLRPHYAIHSINSPGEIEKANSLPDTANSTLANWLNVNDSTRSA